jgi:hypothetical protein
VFIDRVELRILVVLRVVDLDDARRLQRFLGNARDIAHRILYAAAVAAQLAIDDGDQPRDQRSHGQGNQCQPTVEIEQRDDGTDDGQGLTHGNGHGIRGRRTYLLGVVSES